MQEKPFKTIKERYDDAMDKMTIDIDKLSPQQRYESLVCPIAMYQNLLLNEHGDALALTDLFSDALCYDRAAGWCLLDQNGQKHIDHDQERKLAVLAVACYYEFCANVLTWIHPLVEDRGGYTKEELAKYGEESIEDLVKRAFDLRTNRRIEDVLEIASVLMKG